MLRLAADENFDNNILRGLLRVLPAADVIRVQDVGLQGADDPTILEWCAEQRRVLVTHDVATVTRHAHERVEGGLPMPGVIEVHARAAMRAVIADLALVIELAEDADLVDQILYLPL